MRVMDTEQNMTEQAISAVERSHRDKMIRALNTAKAIVAGAAVASAGLFLYLRDREAE